MSDFAWVKHPKFGLFATRSPEVWGGEVTDEVATLSNGRPRPAKPKTSVADKAAAKKSNTSNPGAESATTPEEGSK